MRRMLMLALVLAAAVSALPAAAGGGSYPKTISLPNGWLPEGIATGPHSTFYAGSRATGAVYRGSLRTGAGAVLVPAHPGRIATGLKVDRRHKLLFVAGASTGQGYVYDLRTGADVAMYQFTTSTDTFVNDVVVTRHAAWFTDSRSQVLYKVAIGRHGTLAPTAETIPLTGDLVVTPGFNLNGIDAARHGKWLVVVQSNTGKLFRVNPRTGVTDEIELANGESVLNGDGILLDGKKLYVVQNTNNQVAVVKLSHRLGSGRVVARLTDPALDVPTTIAEHGRRLYVVNARFTTPPTPDTTYTVVQLRKLRGRH